ncbi:unnamed protein product [Paramecium sonneborni]|uniref:Transmembrane protein n=1 Tax=Paramecium sonneborni TaxID=65129 RepID=A0A8S1RJY4_9CILI|nr:unnamed protein product [Paramecium sonneborni]
MLMNVKIADSIAKVIGPIVIIKLQLVQIVILLDLNPIPHSVKTIVEMQLLPMISLIFILNIVIMEIYLRQFLFLSQIVAVVNIKMNAKMEVFLLTVQTLDVMLVNKAFICPMIMIVNLNLEMLSRLNLNNLIFNYHIEDVQIVSQDAKIYVQIVVLLFQIMCYSICGDQYVTPCEQCDDGNLIFDDGCHLCQKICIQIVPSVSMASVMIVLKAFLILNINGKIQHNQFKQNKSMQINAIFKCYGCYIY